MYNLTDEQSKKLQTWIEEQDAKIAKNQGKDSAYYGCIGGGYSYMFTPTTLGCAIVVKNNITKEEINLTDYDSW